MPCHQSPRNPTDGRTLLVTLLDGEQALFASLAPDGLDRSPLAPFAPRIGSEQHRWLHLLGTALWEVFSNNHEVVGSDGRVYDLGSWRGSGATIADVLNADFGSSLDRRLDYLDFYCGFLLARPSCEGDDDLSEPLRPVYRHLFERLQAHGCTWRYAPPGSDRLLPADGGRPAESLPVTARAYRDVYGHAPHSLDSDQER